MELRFSPITNNPVPYIYAISKVKEPPLAVIDFSVIDEKVLLGILAHRFEKLNDSPKACCEYAQILAHLQLSITALNLVDKD